MQIKDVVQLPQLAGLRAPEASRDIAIEDMGPAGAAGGATGSFGHVLGDAIAQVNSLQEQASSSIAALATGDKASLHDTMIAMEQADVSFRMMMQVRNKIVEAYQEIMRMQI